MSKESPQEQSNTKRKRPDRAQQLSDRRNSDETVIVASLRSLLRGSGEQKDRIVEAIDHRVVSYSQRIVLASRALNLAVRQDFAEVPASDLAAADVGFDIIHVNCIRQLLLGTSGCPSATRVQRVHELFEQRPDLLYDPGDRSPYDPNIYTDGAIGYAANIRTHLKENLVDVIKKVVYKCIEGTREQQTLLLFRICGWPDPKPRKGKKDRDSNVVPAVLTPEQSSWATQCRAVLGLATDDQITDKWLDDKDNVPAMLRFSIFSLRLLEERDEKLYNLLPICRRKRHFVTIDTSTLYGIAREAGIVAGEEKKQRATASSHETTIEEKPNEKKTAKKPSGLEAFRSLGEEQWRSILDVDKVASSGGRFTGTIDTDGVSVRVHFRHPKKTVAHVQVKERNKGGMAVPRPPQEKMETSRVIAIDPGRSNIMFAAEVLPDKSVQKYRLTRQQYYREAGIKAAQKQTERWHRGIQPQLTALSQASPKGCSLKAYETFLETDQAVSGNVWEEYSKRRWAQQRLRLYGGKKRVFAHFFNSIEKAGKKRGDHRPILVAYGSAKMAPGGKGEVSVPVSRAFKECNARFETHVVDEFRTTRVCFKDDSILEKVGVINKKPTGERETETVRGLLWCRSTNETRSAGNGKFISRDKNGALNILRCFLLPKRPAVLDRRLCTGQKLPNPIIGRLILR